MVPIPWAEFRDFVDDRNLPLQGREDDDRYYLVAYDGPHGLACWIHKTASTDAAALAEFEADYKAGWNQPVEQRDADKTPMRKERVTSPGWHYGPRCMSLTTAKLATLHNHKHTGESYADATLKFYDASAELVQGGEESDATYQARLATDCVRTELVWTPTASRDAVGGILKLANDPTGDAFAWFIAAPHIAAEYGGSIPFVGGGVPLHILKQEIIHFDGRGVKRIAVDNVYYSHRFGLIVKHAAGEQIKMAIVFEDFVA